LRDRDRLLLEDSLEHGDECIAFLAGVDQDAFLADRKLQLATERLLEIIGEAAGGLSDDALQAIEYDWHAVRGLRNILAHKYGDVDPRRVWSVVRNRLPDLLERVRRTLD
jgi:uncharacterized protein with HEPN domain